MQAQVRADVTSASAHKLGLIISHVEKDHISTHLILTMARVMGLVGMLANARYQLSLLLTNSRGRIIQKVQVSESAEG